MKTEIIYLDPAAVHPSSLNPREDLEDRLSETQKKLTTARKEKNAALKEIKELKQISLQHAQDLEAIQRDKETLEEQFFAKEQECKALAEQIEDKDARIIELEKYRVAHEAEASVTISAKGLELGTAFMQGTEGEINSWLEGALELISGALRMKKLPAVTS